MLAGHVSYKYDFSLHYVVNEICTLPGFYTAKIGSLLPMSHLQGSSCLAHEEGADRYPEAMVTNYQSMLRPRRVWVSRLM